jgi:hypothetical protein
LGITTQVATFKNSVKHLFVLERISLTFNVLYRLVLKGKDEETLQVLAALSDLPMSVGLFAPFTYD